MFALRQSLRVSPRVRDFENIWVRMGAMLSAHYLSNFAGSSSGLVALCGLNLVSNNSTSCDVTVIGGTSLTRGMSNMFGILEVFSTVTTG